MCSLNLNVDAFQYIWKMLRYHIFECCLFLIFYSIFILSLLITITGHHRSKLTICCFCRCLLLTLSFFIVGVCVCVYLYFVIVLYFGWLINFFVPLSLRFFFFMPKIELNLHRENLYLLFANHLGTLSTGTS